MPKYLLIDAGNTCIKWAEAHDGALNSLGSSYYPCDVSTADISALLRLSRSADQIFMLSVTNAQREKLLEEALCETQSAALNKVLVKPQAFGIRTCYEQPERLGVDRWAAMIAARHLVSGPICVVDSGTATTFDLVDVDGHQLGGLIIPGLELMSSSLLDGTAQIHRATNNSQPGFLACDSLSAVATGGLLATIGFIEHLLREAPKMLDAMPTFFLCGGNAKKLLPLLPTGIQHEPDLVLKGLSIIAMDKL